ncbi:hypothetical protein DKX38_011492 [Salix brachista]|uniref:Uncharacterized protein n=1 Tax=Salix brachista TaxID=2182728 RepID=A0A5N5M1M4_9ROSI|nr:hypothetical protein DKX38_011492 [Salix brachista]
MFEHGDDLTIEGHRISWLIWIQILVFLLLLLFCFSFFPADLPDTTTTSSSASPSTPGVFMPLNFHLESQILEQNDRVSNRLQHSQVQQNQSIKGEITTNTEVELRTIGPREIEIRLQHVLLVHAGKIMEGCEQFNKLCSIFPFRTVE